MKLLRLETFGLKGADLQIDLSAPVVALLGPNGAGKTSAIQALQLLATGGLGDGAKTPERVMRLSRGDRLELVGFVDAGGPKPVEIRRRWTRSRDGKIAKKVSVSSLPHNTPIAQAELKITELLGAIPEAWSPDALLGLSPDKLRDRLSRLLPGGDGGETGAGLGYTGEPLAERFRREIEDAKSRLNDRQADARRACAELNGMGFVAPVSDTDPRVRLAELGRELETARAWASADSERKRLEERLTPADLLTPELHPADFERQRSELGEQLRRLEDEIVVEADDGHEIESFSEEDERAADAEVQAIRGEARAAEQQAHALQAAAQSAVSITCPHDGCGRPIEAAAIRASLEIQAAEALEGSRAVHELWFDLDKRLRHIIETRRLAARRATAELAAAEYSRIAEALDALPSAEAIEATKARINDRARYDRLLASLDGEPPRPVAEVEAEHAAQMQALEDRVRQAAERKRYDDLQAAKLEAEDWASREKAKIEELTRREAALVGARAVELERRLSEGIGAEVRVETAPECRITVGGVPLARGVVSDGEWLRAAAALVRVVASISGATWRPLVIDRLEAVSLDRRRPFLESLVAAVRAGEVDQVIVAGCPDTPLGLIEGVDEVHVADEAVRAEVA